MWSYFPQVLPDHALLALHPIGYLCLYPQTSTSSSPDSSVTQLSSIFRNSVAMASYCLLSDNCWFRQNFRENKLLLLFINPQPSVPLLLIPRVLFLFPWPLFTSRSCFYTCCFATCYSVQPSRKLAANAARSAARPSFDRRRTLFLQKYNFQLHLDRTTLCLPKLNSPFFCDPNCAATDLDFHQHLFSVFSSNLSLQKNM